MHGHAISTQASSRKMGVNLEQFLVVYFKKPWKKRRANFGGMCSLWFSGVLGRASSLAQLQDKLLWLSSSAVIIARIEIVCLLVGSYKPSQKFWGRCMLKSKQDQSRMLILLTETRDVDFVFSNALSPEVHKCTQMKVLCVGVKREGEREYTQIYLNKLSHI